MWAIKSECSQKRWKCMRTKTATQISIWVTDEYINPVIFSVSANTVWSSDKKPLWKIYLNKRYFERQLLNIAKQSNGCMRPEYA